MGLFEQFPYSNFHEANIDWVLKLVKKLGEEWLTFEGNYEEFKNNTEKALTDLKNYVDAEINKVTGQSLYEVVNVIINSLYDSGELDNLVASAINLPKIGEIRAKGWLAGGFSNQNNVAIGDYYCIPQGACADPSNGDIYIGMIKSLVDESFQGKGRIVKISSAGIETNAVEIENLGHCNSMTWGGDGNIYIARGYSYLNGTRYNTCDIVMYRASDFGYAGSINLEPFIPQTHRGENANPSLYSVTHDLRFDKWYVTIQGLGDGIPVTLFEWDKDRNILNPVDFEAINGIIIPRMHDQGSVAHNGMLYTLAFRQHCIYVHTVTGKAVGVIPIAKRLDTGMLIGEIEALCPISYGENTEFYLTATRVPFANAWFRHNSISKINLTMGEDASANIYGSQTYTNLQVDCAKVNSFLKVEIDPTSATTNRVVNVLSMGVEMLGENSKNGIQILNGDSPQRCQGVLNVFNTNGFRILGRFYLYALGPINSRFYINELRAYSDDFSINCYASDIKIGLYSMGHKGKLQNRWGNATLYLKDDFTAEWQIIDADYSGLRTAQTEILCSDSSRNTSGLFFINCLNVKSNALFTNNARNAFVADNVSMSQAIIAMSFYGNNSAVGGQRNMLAFFPLRGAQGVGSYDVVNMLSASDNEKFRIITEAIGDVRTIKVSLVINGNVVTDTGQNVKVRFL